ncbi:MAG: ferric reductase-like transmembrane domain-containing protein [Alphaproteobacteria bacterium]|nr:ferric reductase-like transmembrane domain-containing protein [Alphaproteobacteria bacterium]
MLKMIEGKRIFVPVTLILVGYTISQIMTAGSYVAALPYLMTPSVDFAFIFFFFAFTASSLARLAPGNGPRFLMRNRRYIGLCFALVHGAHGVFVLSNLALTDETRPPLVFAAGALAYALLIAMTLTSNNASVRRLGAKRWKLLHKVGSYFIWAIFASKAPEILKLSPVSWIPILCFVALGLRIAAYQKGRKKQKQMAA